jgi:2,4-dienoyl-CoA reductase-like NADH-dependent reductase (Old Yellow Enzyme family)
MAANSVKSTLFSPLRLRSLTLPHRVAMSPMCQYSATDGVPNDWHYVHYASRAVGQVGLILSEATAVVPEGRISAEDTGLWNDTQVAAWKRITDAIRSHGSIPGIQLAHAGRKASVPPPWKEGKQLPPGAGGWETVAPSPIPFLESDTTPTEMTDADIEKLVSDFELATKRALAAGFDVVEVHNAHGYLLHEFLSPLANKRTDRYGGCIENRMKVPLRVAEVVRNSWPAHLPVFVRLSATDWMGTEGWDVPDSIVFGRELKKIGIDLIDVSSGGSVPNANIPVKGGYQVAFARAIRTECDILTGAVGLITDSKQADEVIASGDADVIFLGRALLRDPHWVLRAAHDLHTEVPWPKQYERAKVSSSRPF